MTSTIRCVCTFAAAIGLMLLGLAPAFASAAEPALKVSASTPDYVTPGKKMYIEVSIQRLSDTPLSGKLLFKVTYPLGVVPFSPAETEGEFTPGNSNVSPTTCTLSAQVEQCEVDVSSQLPESQFRFKLVPEVEAGAEGPLMGEFEISGGGSGETITRPFNLDTGTPNPFSYRAFDVVAKSGPEYPATQAGGTPAELTTTTRFTTETRIAFGEFPSPNAVVTTPKESFRDVVVHVPAGLVGLPRTPQRCTAAQLTTQLPSIAIPQCPAQSQVGLVQFFNGDIVPVYNVVPAAGVPAELGFFYQGVPNVINARVRPGDHGIDLVTNSVPNTIPLPSFEVSLWGVPGDSSHDYLRTKCLALGFGNACADPQPIEGRAPFLRNPTSCTGSPLPWSIEVDTYQHPGTFVGRSTTSPPMEGCEELPFDPAISAGPSVDSPNSPSGLDFSLTMPQAFSEHSLAEADLRSASVTFPPGLSINPASADGLASCTDAQLGLGKEGPAECPDASKLGTVEVTTPLLEEPIGGSVFLRTQNSNDPASGEMYRLAIELRLDQRGLAIKLPGQLKVDPSTGQLTTEFDELPQLPFEAMDLHFKTGPRAPLTTPADCGSYTTLATLTGWSGKTVRQGSTFNINQGCDHPGFAPGFEAGVANPRAGGYSPFTLRVTRDAGMPNLDRISATLPEGELAKLAGVPLCSDVAAADGGCPSSSRIGRTVAGVGEGSSPLYLPQPGKAPTAVYLAGPYKGAPYSVVASVPAQSGPFDLGTVVVRSALSVDPVTTRATVTSDPLPQIFGGIPVSYRDVRVEVDRPEFTLTPTSCEPQAVDGKVAVVGGESAAVSARFQASDCAALGFKPKLSLYLKGKTRRAGYPALTAVLKMPKDGANVARASVALPHAEFLAQNHIDTSCTRVQYAADGGGGAGCPKGSVYGRARAFSPLLDQPLEGPLYLRSNGGERELPDLVASLDGQIHVDLVGYIDSDKKTGGLRTTFANVPDAPVSKFVLRMPGGRMSLLRNSTNICHGKQRAIVKMSGQNGRLASSLTPLKVKGCGPRNGGP